MKKVRNLLKSIFLYVCTMVATISGKKNKPAILMYHSFDTEDWRYGVDPAEFENQINYLLKKRQIVPLSKVVNWVTGEGELVANAVAITVDDGYADTYEIFFPLAKKYQLPFTLFLTTNLEPQEKLGNLKRPTVAQLKEMLDSGLMTLGLHGHSHINFTEVFENGLVESEIVASEQYLKNELGVTVADVAYPAGRLNQEVTDYFSKAGYRSGVSTRPGFVSQGDDVFTLKRIGVDRATSRSLFRLRLLVGFPLYLNLVRWCK